MMNPEQTKAIRTAFLAAKPKAKGSKRATP